MKAITQHGTIIGFTELHDSILSIELGELGEPRRILGYLVVTQRQCGIYRFCKIGMNSQGEDELAPIKRASMADMFDQCVEHFVKELDGEA